MDYCVAIPTFNELDNIQQLVSQVLATDPRLHVVVVDDASPDGTGAWVEDHSQTEPRVHALRRGGRFGYASAIKDGLRFGLDRGARFVLHMDADFSHDPSHLPQILAASQAYDVVVGSRYIPGGGTRNWGLHRRLLSSGANLVARTVLGLGVHDCTGGFRCYRRETFDKVDLFSIEVEGYGFLVAILFRLQQAGLRVGEVPIVFVDRQYGKSKLSRRIILEAMWLVFRLGLSRINPWRARG